MQTNRYDIHGKKLIKEEEIDKTNDLCQLCDTKQKLVEG